MSSYDLDMDTRLSEETTVLVETYTVSTCLLLLAAQISVHNVGFLASRRTCHQSWTGTL